MTPTLTFVCSICGEPSVSICVYCTKDACPNHVCDRCGRCSDCCECDIRLEEHPEYAAGPEISPGPEESAELSGDGLPPGDIATMDTEPPPDLQEPVAAQELVTPEEPAPLSAEQWTAAEPPAAGAHENQPSEPEEPSGPVT